MSSTKTDNERDRPDVQDQPTTSSGYFADPPKKEKKEAWCLRENDWTKKIDEYINEGKDDKSKAKATREIFELHMQLFRCAIKELAKVKRQFVLQAVKDMKDPAIEENLTDYRECILPIIHKVTYSNFDKYQVNYGYVYAFKAGQSYRMALAQVIKNGCAYNKDLKKHAETAYSFSLDIMCLLSKAHKFLNIKPQTMKNITLPDYVTKDVSNTVLYIRDFLIVRDFHDYCKRMAVIFAFLKRKVILMKMAKPDK